MKGLLMSPLLVRLVVLVYSTAQPQATGPFVDIPAGKFLMGYSKLPLPQKMSSAAFEFPNGDFDEHPWHSVSVSAFRISATEITNAQYELFDPSHKQLRGKYNFSPDDDDAVLWVSHSEATAYCAWLTQHTSDSWTYRLPTEAEWEHVARGNSTTNASYFWTGDTVPESMQNNQKASGMPQDGVPTKVARFPPNGFGVYDTLGNVEEWVSDWHGAYPADHTVDPTGPATGFARVTRGGSHSTEIYYLRTANRAAALPSDKSWYIGFRCAASKTVLTNIVAPVPLSAQVAPLIAKGFQSPSTWPKWSTSALLPIRLTYVNILMPQGKSQLPFNLHNHDPGVVACPDGSILASWFSTNCGENGRCVGIVNARLEKGASNWTWATVDFRVEDRTQCCPAFLLQRSTGTLVQFSGVSAAGDSSGALSTLSGVLRLSDDCGRSYAEPVLIWPEHGLENNNIATAIETTTGEVMIPCDHWGTIHLPKPPVELGDQSIVQHVASFADMFNASAWHRAPLTGGVYNDTGIHHSSIVELRHPGHFAAIGREQTIGKDNNMPISFSSDGGYTWLMTPTPFPQSGGGHRPIMRRLGSIDQPILLCAFADDPFDVPCGSLDSSCFFKMTGLFCAVSQDDGATWVNRRIITTDTSCKGTNVLGFDDISFVMSYRSAEPDGYMDFTVSDDGVIHLITSKNHYQFNLPWMLLRADPPPC